MRTVLVIDDSELIRMAAEIGLSAEGWRVLCADSGAAGIELAALEQPDAILLDLVMPDLDGVATFQELRAQAQTRELPVVFLTARPDQVEAGAGTGPGAKGTIVKPFAPTELGAELSRIMGWAR